MRTREELELIASIADELAAGVWVATAPDGRFVYANQAFAEIMGTAGRDDVAAGEYAVPYGIYRRDGVLYPEEELPFARALCARATVVVDDIVIHRPDGRQVFVRAQARPMFAADGCTITHVCIAFFDITREVQAERARAEAERWLRRVVQNAPIVLFATDARGIITFVEGRGLTRLGRRPDELIGRTGVELFPESRRVEELDRLRERGETVREVVDFGPVTYEIHSGPLFDAAGQLAGNIGVAIDVTDRRRVEMQLARAERLASVGMLAAGVAHEVNNPLSFVIGNLDLMAETIAEGLALAPSAALSALGPMLNDARLGADRVRSIVRGLKVFSRVNDEQPSAPIDLRAPLEAALSMAQNEIRHRAKLVVDVQRAPLVLGDQGRVAQLFLNLLINAAQSIPDGPAEGHQISVVLREDGEGWARVEVNDSGVGIPRDVLPRIFDPFFTTKPVGVGTGLGLSICHAIVTDLGGRIEVSSEVGHGSRFLVLIPPAGPVAPPPSGEHRISSRGQRRGRVLVVDDEPVILKLVEGFLSREHEVASETRAEAALQRILGGARYDVIVCDLMMPEMSGMELYQRLVEIAPEQARAILFVTGGAFTAKARAFLDQNPHAVIEKPFDAATLVERVRQMVAEAAPDRGG